MRTGQPEAMCLIAWNWQPHSATPLLLLSNRDEFYARSADPLQWWSESGFGSDILAGQDLQAGGTWLGVSRSGRLAAITNYRTTEPVRTDTRSRGELVAQFLNSQASADEFLRPLAEHCCNYNPFNLLVFDGQQLMGLESLSARVLHLPPGIGAVSNARFNTPWPKLTRLAKELGSQVAKGHSDAARLLPLLLDRNVASDPDLPLTGVPLPLERMLSATFIASPEYGTRACSMVAIHTTHVDFTEQSYGAHGALGTNHQRFALRLEDRLKPTT
jgi:uncharacterized protein with NRDE domain